MQNKDENKNNKELEKRPFSNKLNLIDFINKFNCCEYAIIKIWDDFPNYYPNSDIDIFCLNINEIAKKIIASGNTYLEKGFEIEIVEIDSCHKQVDFVLDGKIDFR